MTIQTSDTIYLPDEGRVVTALANRIYRFEETGQSTTEPIISSSSEALHPPIKTSSS